MKSLEIYLSRLLLIVTVILTLTFPSMAQMEEPDTLLHLNSNSKVIITENSSGTLVEVRDTTDGLLLASVLTEFSDESNVKSTSTEGKIKSWIRNRNFINHDQPRHSYWGVSLDGVCIGLNRAVGQGDPGPLQWSKSFEICWMSCFNVYYKTGYSKFSLGLGFDWRNYRITTSDPCLKANPDGGISISSCPDNYNSKFSRLKVFSLQLPLLYEFNFPKSTLGIKAGPICCFNTYASLKNVWEDTYGNRIEEFTKEIDPRRFTLDFFAALTIDRCIGIYARYSPMKVMENHSSFNFHPLTIGVTIGI